MTPLNAAVDQAEYDDQFCLSINPGICQSVPERPKEALFLKEYSAEENLAKSDDNNDESLPLVDTCTFCQ